MSEDKTALMTVALCGIPGRVAPRHQIYQVRVATATKRSPRFRGAQLNPSHGTGAWALQEL